MANSRKPIPPYVQRGLLGLIIVLMGISVARLLVTMHQQQERIEILEEQVFQLMSDTSRLQISPYTPQRNQYYSTNHSHSRNDYHRRSYSNRTDESVHNRHKSDNVSPRPATTTHAESDSISPTSNIFSANNNHASTVSSSDTPSKRKFTEVHQFDLNTIDSATLVRIPGIAERTAAVILKNRHRYGGFYSPWQLQEFLTWEAAQAYMEEWCNAWFTADANHIRPIHINSATVSEMQRHPYISHEQAMELARYRTRHKRITSVTELNQMQTLNEEQIKQLLPYLAFD